MGKHAYLIMAHQDFYTLEKLLLLLDHLDSDIFLHIDSKSQEFSEESVRKIDLIYSELHFVKRMNVKWGGYSMIQCELRLLEDAVKNSSYDYYHLISGVDLPIKSQEYIHKFFRDHTGYEFIGFSEKDNEEKDHLYRVKYYYGFQNYVGRNFNPKARILRTLQNYSVGFQRRIGVDRVKASGIKFYKGPNWFSITHPLALYTLARQDFFKKHFYKTVTADELFLQTMVMDSPFSEKLFGSSMREVDWTRDNPYTYTSDDFEMLMKSERLFARKFGSQHDKNIIDQIYNELKT